MVFWYTVGSFNIQVMHRDHFSTTYSFRLVFMWYIFSVHILHSCYWFENFRGVVSPNDLQVKYIASPMTIVPVPKSHELDSLKILSVIDSAAPSHLTSISVSSWPGPPLNFGLPCIHTSLVPTNNTKLLSDRHNCCLTDWQFRQGWLYIVCWVTYIQYVDI